MTEWARRLDALTEEAEQLLDPMICRTPGGVGGSQPGRHCAECCMGTLIAVESKEEYDVAVALRQLVIAVEALRGVTLRPCRHEHWAEHSSHPIGRLGRCDVLAVCEDCGQTLGKVGEDSVL